MKSPKVAIVMPAYNEEKTIGSVIEKTKQYGDIIVVNDASSDNTGKIAKSFRVNVITHETNQGLGQSLRDGFKEAVKRNYGIIITIDADCQHNPEDVPRFVEEIQKGNGFVLGARNLSRYPFVKKFGNFFLNAATNFISGTYLKDTESGYRAFTAEALKTLRLKANRYEIAVEIIFEIGRNRIKSSNISIDSPLYVKGVGIKDGMRNFLYLLHRRERKWRDYLTDFRYVMKRHFWL